MRHLHYVNAPTRNSFNLLYPEWGAIQQQHLLAPGHLDQVLQAHLEIKIQNRLILTSIS